MSRVLVAFFSATGTTKKIAEEICKVENGDLFEIVPETPYTKEDLDYTVKESRSSREMTNYKCRPAIASKCDNFDDYNTVFVGFPIWWGREPSIVDTFMEAYDFTGKTIIPFCTSGVTEIARAVQHIKEIIGYDMCVDAGKRLGPDATEKDIRTWKDLLGE